MEGFIYVKVLLYAYPKLNMMAEAVSAGAEIKALLSFRGRADALTEAERIAEEIAMSCRLLRAKETLDEALGRCSEEELFLLEYKYFRRRRVLAERFAGRMLNCSERSYFRMQVALLRKMAALLTALGMTEREFFSRFGEFPPFLRVYRAIEEGRERSVVFKRRRREIAFRQNSVSCGSGERLARSTSSATATAAAPTTHRTTICTTEGEETAGSSSAGGRETDGLR